MGFPLKIALVSAVATALLYYAGFGITRLLAFRRIEGGELLVMPFAGLSVMVPVGYWCAWLGWSAGVALIVALILSTVLNGLALFRRSGAPLRVGEQLGPLALAVVALAIALVPMARSGQLGPIGLNGDQVLYSNVTAYLEKNGLPAPPPDPSKPAVVQRSFINWGLPLGFNFFHAFVDRLTGVEAHESFSVLTAIFLALAVPALSLLARSLLGLGPRSVLLAALLAALSPVLLWVHYNDYGMHVMSLGLVPVALGVAVLALEDGAGRARLLAALLLSTAFTSYPFAAAPLALAPLAVYALVLHFAKRQPLVVTLKRLAVLGALALVLNLPGILHVGKLLLPMFRLILAQEFGDITGHVHWSEVYGLSHHRVSPPPLPVALFPGLSTALATLALVVAAYGVWRGRGPGRLVLLSFALAYVPFLLWLRFVHDYPYGFFKALTSSAFAAILGTVLGLDRLVEAKRESPGRKVFVGGFLALLLLVNVSYTVRLSRVVASVDLKPLAALRGVKSVAPEGETIHVRDDRGVNLLWVTYFLGDRDLSLGHYSPYYMWRDWPFYQNAIRAGLVLVRKDASLGEPWAGEVIYENGEYRLLRKHPRVVAHVDFDDTARRLAPGQEMKISVLPDRISVDGTIVSLGVPLHGEALSLRVGTYAPRGTTLRLGSRDRWESLALDRDVLAIDRPIAELPMEITLANGGGRAVLVPGWVEVVRPAATGAPDLAPEGVFERFRDEVIPGSGFFTVDGWHTLEEGSRRWTNAVGLSVFRNPLKPMALSVEGILPDQPGARAQVALNGTLVGEIDGPGSFSRSFPLSNGLLGSSAWGELAVRADRVFNPRALELSSDCRDLGVMITGLRLRDLALPASGVIDLGAPEARGHLGSGWSGDEKWGDRTMVWADAPESLVWWSFLRPADFLATVTLRPFAFPSAPPQRVRVFVNGRFVVEITVAADAWRSYSFRLPRSLLAPGVNTLRFVYGYVAAPSKVLPGNPDQRTLAVAVDSIEFREER